PGICAIAGDDSGVESSARGDGAGRRSDRRHRARGGDVNRSPHTAAAPVVPLDYVKAPADGPAPIGTPLLDVKDLKTYFPIRRGILSRTVGYVKAVDGVSFIVQVGKKLGLVGESGSGKTTV